MSKVRADQNYKSEKCNEYGFFFFLLCTSFLEPVRPIRRPNHSRGKSLLSRWESASLTLSIRRVVATPCQLSTHKSGQPDVDNDDGKKLVVYHQKTNIMRRFFSFFRPPLDRCSSRRRWLLLLSVWLDLWYWTWRAGISVPFSFPFTIRLFWSRFLMCPTFSLNSLCSFVLRTKMYTYSCIFLFIGWLVITVSSVCTDKKHLNHTQ